MDGHRAEACRLLPENVQPGLATRSRPTGPFKGRHPAWPHSLRGFRPRLLRKKRHTSGSALPCIDRAVLLYQSANLLPVRRALWVALHLLVFPALAESVGKMRAPSMGAQDSDTMPVQGGMKLSRIPITSVVEPAVIGLYAFLLTDDARLFGERFYFHFQKNRLCFAARHGRLLEVHESLT